MDCCTGFSGQYGLDAALGMYSPAAVSELGVFMQDLFTALFVVGGVALAFAALSVQMRTAKSTALLSVGFLLIGFAVGLKLTNLPFAAGAAIAFIPSLNVRQWRSVAVSYVALGCGFLLGGGYWMWNMWVRYRNPFFFLFNGVFKSPYAVPTDVNLDGRFLPTSLQKWILYPFYFISIPRRFPSIAFSRLFNCRVLCTAGDRRGCWHLQSCPTNTQCTAWRRGSEVEPSYLAGH